MISVYRKRHEDLPHFFKMESGLVACTDIDGLMQTLNINHNPLDWRLYIDSSKLSLKAVPLHSGNTLPSIPVGHSVHNKELYDSMKILMEAINYDKFKWQILPYYEVCSKSIRRDFFSTEANEAREVCSGREMEGTFMRMRGFFPASIQCQSRAASV